MFREKLTWFLKRLGESLMTDLSKPKQQEIVVWMEREHCVRLCALTAINALPSFLFFFFTPLEPSAEESHGTSLDLTNGPFYHARSQKDTWLVYIMIFLTFKFPQTLYSSLLSNKYLLLHWFWTSNPVGGGKSTAHNLYHVLTTDSTSGLWQQKYEKSKAYFLDLNQTTTSFSSPLSWCCKY